MGMDLGSYLALARRERGFTQRELAEKCGSCASEICRLEAGKRVKPSPALLHALSEALLVSYPYLMQLAGYSAGEAEELPEQEPEQVFLDENGNIVALTNGARDMMTRDAAWANAAFRVSRELDERERSILTDMAMSFLKRRKEEGK